MEWQDAFGTTSGYEHDPDELRTEAPLDFVHGDSLVIIDSSSNTKRFTDQETDALTAYVRARHAGRTIIFVNAPDFDGFCVWRGALRDIIDPAEGAPFWPIALGTLSYIVLTTTLVYLDFAPTLSWRKRNYL